MAINPGNAAPGTVDTVLNSMVDMTSSKAQRFGAKGKKAKPVKAGQTPDEKPLPPQFNKANTVGVK